MLAAQEDHANETREELQDYIVPRLIDIISKREQLIEEVLKEDRDPKCVTKLIDICEALMLLINDEETFANILCYYPDAYSWIIYRTWNSILMSPMISDKWKQHLTRKRKGPYHPYYPKDDKLTKSYF